MSVLTEKECKKALEQLDEIVLYLDTNFHKNTAWKLSEAKQVLNQLSHAYFDNPPLRWEEIEEGMWIFDSKTKRMMKVYDISYSDKSFNVNGEWAGSDLYLEEFAFEDNRFYRQPVKNTIR